MVTGKRDGLTRFIAIAGFVLIWLPLVAPIFFSVAAFIQRGRFLFDYLLPAELFPVELFGGLLLTWAAFRAKSYKKLICWSFFTAFLLLVGSQGLAIISGLASGETEPQGLLFSFVIITLILYYLILVVLGCSGCLLIKELSKRANDNLGDPQLPQG